MLLELRIGIRSSDLRGRTPAQIAIDAERLFEKVSQNHVGATSTLTYYEVEEALYRMLADSAKGVSRADVLLIPAARSITTQVQMVIELFSISILDLTSEVVRLQLQQICKRAGFELLKRCMRQAPLGLMRIFSSQLMIHC